MHLKTIPEDFVVEELATHTLASGPYTLFQLQKRNMTTEHAITALQNFLRIPRRFLSYAGTKDKQAVTTQYVTAKCTREHIEQFTHPQITLTVLGTVKEPCSLGLLEGNRFTIVVRKLHTTAQQRTQFPNYFDEQRFSTANVAIGRHILQGNFAAAVSLIDEACVHEHLAKHPTDPIGALRTLAPKHALLYVHAYQSFLFNTILTRYIQHHDPAAQHIAGPVPIALPTQELQSASLPLVGFTELAAPYNTWYEELLTKDNLTQRDFVVRSLPFLTVEGTVRDAFFTAQDMKRGSLEEDDLHAGYKKQTLSFMLPKGCYATIAVKCLYPHV